MPHLLNAYVTSTDKKKKLNILVLCGPRKVYSILEKEIFQYLIFGTVKSEGSFEIFTICGLFGNFSKMRRRNGSFSFVSALASLCFS